MWITKEMSIAKAATDTISNPENIPMLKLESSKALKVTLKPVLIAKVWFSKLKKSFLNIICIISLVLVVLIVRRNWMLLISLMPMMDIFTADNAIQTSMEVEEEPNL